MRVESIRLETRSALEEESRRPASILDFSRTPRWAVLALFAALLIPCFWQSRIQSADLGSHIYNAWLAVQIHRGAIHGLWIAHQTNNILFDVLLEWLFTRVGADAAQHIAVALCVLIFTSGAFAFIFRVSGKANWWFVAPSVAMLAYGFTFHIGFFNFYLSMGLCLWYLAFFWNGGWRTRLLALPVLIVAWLAHPFPVVWAIGIAAYVAVARISPEKRRIQLLACGLCVLIVVQMVLAYRYRCAWSPRQILYVTGANQLSVFGAEYEVPFAALLFVWLRQLWKVKQKRGLRGMLASLPFQLWLLSAAGVIVIPDQIMFPQYGLPFEFITSRLSLCAGLILCSVLATAPMTRFDRVAVAVVAVTFFSLLYHDEFRLNRLEERVDGAIGRLPPMQRVIAQGPQRSLAWLCFLHDVERACIGRCLSYSNYEPSSRQFRIRAADNNGIVLSEYADVNAVQLGTYVVRARDLPLDVIYPCGKKLDQVCSRELAAGKANGSM